MSKFELFAEFYYQNNNYITSCTDANIYYFGIFFDTENCVLYQYKYLFTKSETI